MAISEVEILQVLESDGFVWTEYFVLNSLVVARKNSKGVLMAKLIEDDKLAAATKAFLVLRGHAASKAEDWPPVQK